MWLEGTVVQAVQSLCTCRKGSGEMTDLQAWLTLFPIMCIRKSPSFLSSCCLIPAAESPLRLLPEIIALYLSLYCHWTKLSGLSFHFQVPKLRVLKGFSPWNSLKEKRRRKGGLMKGSGPIPRLLSRRQLTLF